MFILCVLFNLICIWLNRVLYIISHAGKCRILSTPELRIHKGPNHFLITQTFKKGYIIIAISRNSVSVGKFQNSTGGRTDTMTLMFQHSSSGRKGNPEVLLWFYLHSASIPLLACCGWACAYSHTQAYNKDLTCADHAIKRATNNWLHFHDDGVCSHVWMRPHVPGQIQ